ncbi:MAG: hypothetical protein QM535_02830 [Limnohabitans sp.]|nr:hypothetical protein [Limnohabitans sp.]
MKIPTTPDDFQNEFYSSIELIDKIGSQRIQQLIYRLDKVEEEVIIGGIIKIFQNTERPNTECLDQEYAGKILDKFKPKTDLDLLPILKSTIGNWNKSVEEFPFWIKENYGMEYVKIKIAEFEKQNLTEIEKDKLTTLKWWLKM